MATTEYVFNAAGQRVSEWNATTHAQLKGKYYWGGKPVAYYANGSMHFEHQDWLGTERLRTTYNGGVEGSYNSLPFGDGQAATGADADANHYAQLDHDTETATDHAQFRQYSNTQGRWLSPDPYSGSYKMRNPQSFNRYVYAGNNPLAAVDPSGLDENDGCPDEMVCNFGGDGSGDGGYDASNGEGGWGWDSAAPSYDMAADPCAGIPNCVSVNGGDPPYIATTPTPYRCIASDSQCQDVFRQLFQHTSPTLSLDIGRAFGGAANNGTPLKPEQIHKQQQTKLNQKCAAAAASSAALATNAGMNEVGAALTGEVSPFAAIFHGIALGEGIASGGMGVYAAFACYNAAQF